jgi:hypothetical protein
VESDYEYFCKPKRSRAFLLGAAGVVALAALVLGWFLFGPGGDLRRLEVRLLADGGAPGHKFDEGSRLAGVSFRRLNLRRAEFPQVDLTEADFSGARLRGATFTRCTLAGANFRGAELVFAAMDGCDLAGADLCRADLRKANLTGSSLRSALLVDALLRGANLAGVDLTNAAGINLADLRMCANWHRAVYDEDMVAAIRREFPPAAVVAAGFASWDDWAQTQRELGTAQAPPPHTQ